MVASLSRQPRAHLTMRCLLLPLVTIIATFPTPATTLVVFYDSANGAILAIDSAATLIEGVDIEQPKRVGPPVTRCKFHSCGKYLVALTGIGGIEGKRDVALICKDCATASPDIDTFASRFTKEMVDQAGLFASYLFAHNRPLQINDVLNTIAIIGFDSGGPALRFGMIRFTGISRPGMVDISVTDIISCPGQDPGCANIRIMTGLTDAIIDARNAGKYRHQNDDPLVFAEELIQIEIDAHKNDRLVGPPISIVQIKNEKPQWFRRGLCQACATRMNIWLVGLLGTALVSGLIYALHVWKKRTSRQRQTSRTTKGPKRSG